METKRLFEDKFIGYHTFGLVIDNCVKDDDSGEESNIGGNTDPEDPESPR